MSTKKNLIECGKMQNQFKSMKGSFEIIKLEFEKDIKKEGLYWRISRPNTFVDMLMLKSHTISKNGIDQNTAIRIIIIATKAIINMKFGLVDYCLNYEKLTQVLRNEKENIEREIDYILINSTKNSSPKKSTLLYDELSYFKVLSNLNIDNYSIEIFEDIVASFVHFINSEQSMY